MLTPALLTSKPTLLSVVTTPDTIVSSLPIARFSPAELSRTLENKLLKLLRDLPLTADLTSVPTVRRRNLTLNVWPLITPITPWNKHPGLTIKFTLCRVLLIIVDPHLLLP